MNIQYIHPADQLVMFMQRIYDKGLTTMSGGNLSIRDTQGNIWITPAGIDKGTLTRKDIICVHPDGSCEGPHKPSSELPFHESVYRMRPDLNAVLHAHPPALVAFSIVRKLPDLDLIPSVRHICEQMKIAKNAVPVSESLGAESGKVIAQGCDAALLENHGVCIGAPDMFTAFQRFETLNYTATLEVLGSKLGNIHSLPENAYHMSETNAHTKLDDFIPRSHTSEELAARRDMITLIHRSYKMGLFTATHGTYSVRLSDGSFLITPFGFDRAYLEEDDLVRVKGGMKELGKTPSRAVLLHQKKNHYLRIGLAITAVITAMALVGCFWTPYAPTAMSGSEKFAAPSLRHLFGTDNFGRDIFSRVMVGARTTFFISACTVTIGAVVGTLVGALTGYFGGLVDELLMRVNDAVTAFPSILLALVFISLLGFGTYNVILALGIAFIPSYARVIRGEFARQREMNYVKNARLMGASHLRIMLVHILPNTRQVLLPTLAIGFNNAVLAEASMSFLGIGVKPPEVSLGYMMSESQSYMVRAPWYMLTCGSVIVLLILGVSLIGEGLQQKKWGR